MNNWEVDVPVYMIFFNRPDTFEKVFEAVKNAKPSKLFFACDGARANREEDNENIRKCKEIASHIDWDCEVHTNYSDENLGCGKRMVSGIDWAFQYVDRLIIIEDDCVLSKDFFHFCVEVLEKYKDDDRIYMIAAMNHLGKYDKPHSSYFFAQGHCWGWATWKRAWKNVDFTMEFMEDEYSMRNVEKLHPYYSNAYAQGLKQLKSIRDGVKQSTWTYQSGMCSALQSQISIVPSVNLVSNIGLTADSGHAVTNLKKLPKRQRAYFNAPIYKMDFPLAHPKYMVEDLYYYKAVKKKFKVTVLTKLEGYIRRIIYAEKGDIKKMVSKIPHKLFRR